MPLISVLIILLFLPDTANAAGITGSAGRLYLQDKLFCVTDGDCALREGVCGFEPMNVYYDNSKLIQVGRNVGCPEIIRENPRCDQGKCVADLRDPSGQNVGRDDTAKYLDNRWYCKSNSDCALREGACGLEPMNIYYDNAPLIAMRPYVECADGIAQVNPRCEQNSCVADMKESWECTAEARMCPDGSAVGRTGPNCEFAKCPGEK